MEVFTTTGGKLPPICKTVGNIKREYDKNLKGFLLEIEGGRENKVCLPPDEKDSIGLLQPNLVLQILVPHGKSITLDLAVSDQSKSRRVLSFSSSHRDFKQTSPTMARIPFDVVRRGVWLNLCLDVRSLLQVMYASPFSGYYVLFLVVHAERAPHITSLRDARAECFPARSLRQESFPGADFWCIDAIAIYPNCRLRRVFTTRRPLSETGSHPSPFDYRLTRAPQPPHPPYLVHPPLALGVPLFCLSPSSHTRWIPHFPPSSCCCLPAMRKHGSAAGRSRPGGGRGGRGVGRGGRGGGRGPAGGGISGRGGARDAGPRGPPAPSPPVALRLTPLALFGI